MSPRRDRKGSEAPSEPMFTAVVDTVRSSPQHDVRGVLEVRPFRRLWIALGLSSLGDWLGLLATTALAKSLSNSYSGQAFAVGGVLIVRLAPAVLMGPFGGAIADRFDRRLTMVVCDVLRCLLFISIPVVHRLDWLYAASFLIEAISLLWIPAKEASVPNLLPPERLEAANQLSLITTYGSAPIAAVIFSLISLLARALGSQISFFQANPSALALYFNAGTFLFSAFTVLRLHEITSARRPIERSAGESVGFVRSISEGWRFVGQTPLIRGLVIGILGAFGSGGFVIALLPLYVPLLGGGDAAYGLLFGGVFLGLALGMAVGPRLLRDFSRRRLFGLAIMGAGITLSVLSVVPNLVLALLLDILIGFFAGIAWVIGYTLLGLEVADELRGRTFAFVQSLVRIDLLLSLAAAPVVVGAIGSHSVRVGHLQVRADGVTIVWFVAGVFAAAVGVASLRQMDDRPGVSIRADVVRALRRRASGVFARPHGGLFVAFEGGEGTGKTTQIALLAGALRDLGYEVVETREPGGTSLGTAVRALLLDPDASVSPRAEALLYAADRAEHVHSVIRPALDRGAVVLTDRYVDSSLAYQGAGRVLDVSEVERLSTWATSSLKPDVVVLLDLDVSEGLARAGRRGAADRLEAETVEFHERVRQGFLELASADPRRYLVVPAAMAVEEVAQRVREAVEPRLAAVGVTVSVSQGPGAGSSH